MKTCSLTCKSERALPNKVRLKPISFITITGPSTCWMLKKKKNLFGRGKKKIRNGNSKIYQKKEASSIKDGRLKIQLIFKNNISPLGWFRLQRPHNCHQKNHTHKIGASSLGQWNCNFFPGQVSEANGAYPIHNVDLITLFNSRK